MPCVRNIYLATRSLALSMLSWEVYDSAHVDPEISLCKSLHDRSVPMFLSNERSWGWLKDPSELNDLMFYENATQDWETKFVDRVSCMRGGCVAKVWSQFGADASCARHPNCLLVVTSARP